MRTTFNGTGSACPTVAIRAESAHPTATDWTRLARISAATAGTPCFVLSERRVHQAWTRLRRLECAVRVRHWLSLKTLPARRLLDVALSWGLGVEVVSEYELAAALRSGVAPASILVNGVGKHQWLATCGIRELTVHFDSLAEVDRLAEIAADLGWRVGVRCAIPRPAAVAAERGVATAWDQFGMTMEELGSATARLSAAGATVSGVHFHIQTNVERADDYLRALEYTQYACATSRVEPSYVDIGGGLPIPGERPLIGASAAATFSLEQFHAVLRRIPGMFPRATEVWLENGRFLTGAAGALVMTVLEKKERANATYVICDGGRTNHARMATTEVHDVVLVPNRGGPETDTVVCGPTCGAVDRLGCWRLPASLAPGDLVIWLNAGAYHIPLETRFSFGLAPVVWFTQHDDAELIRRRETAAEWWQPWLSP